VSLEQVHAGRLFDDATTDEKRVRVYVSPGELGIGPRADVELMRRLRLGPAPQLVQVVGPSGAGKTSLIMRVLADLGALELDPAPEALVLRIGDDPTSLATSTDVMRLVLGTIEAQRFRFSSVDPRLLQAAGSDSVTETPTHMTHEIGVAPPLASYSLQIEETFRSFTSGDNPARVRQNLEDVLAAVRAAGHRPVLVLDDTEKFVMPAPTEEVDEEAIANLYGNGVRALAELEIDLVVAAHPRFEAVDQVTAVTTRFGFERIECPLLPPESEPVALAVILARRLKKAGLDLELGAVIEPEAVAALQVLYHGLDSDLRSALTAAHDAVGHAIGREAGTVEARDVRAVIAQHPRR
jgi:hypothetical protein